MLSRITAEIAVPLQMRRTRLVLGLGFAAALGMLLVLTVVHRQQSQAEAQIAANAAPRQFWRRSRRSHMNRRWM